MVSQEQQRIWFDNSLQAFVAALISTLSIEEVTSGWVVRDASGRLFFVCAKSTDDVRLERASAAAYAQANPYVRPDSSVVDIDFPGANSVIEQARPYLRKVQVSADATVTVNVVDQRIVGSDWLTPPSQLAQGAPRYAFASIKGGVGRTTALAVAARDMALRGHNVLIIDLDLEAPGIGSILLNESDLPRFGMLDATVDMALAPLDNEYFLDMVSPSSFGDGRGLIDVVPAVGRSGREHPADVLAKLSRSYIESVSGIDGEVLSFAGRTRALVDRLCSLKRYDIVFIDARAGLHESTASAVLNLGANVLLFGEDTPQTFAGYRFLLAHLAQFPRSPDDDWLERVRMIHAKASPIPERQQLFRDRAYEIFREFLYADEELGANEVTLSEFSIDDENAPHYAVPILRDTNYLEFDPLTNSSVMLTSIYERTYQALIDWLDRPLAAGVNDE